MNRKISKSFILIIILVIIYIGFIFSSDITQIQKNILKVEITNLFLIIGLWSISNFLRTVRWHFFLKEIDKKIPFKENVIYYLSGFALVLSPGRIGEIIRSPYLKRDYGISIPKSASIVFVERFYDLLGIIIILTIGLFFVEFDKTVLIAPITITIIFIIVFQNKKLLSKILDNLSKIKPLKILNSNFDESYNSIRKIIKTKFFILGIFTSISSYFFQAIAVYLIILSLNGIITIEQVFVVYPTSMFVSVLSLIPGGVGVFEGGMVSMFSIFGLDYEMAITTSIIIRIISLGLFSVIGMICLRIISIK